MKTYDNAISLTSQIFFCSTPFRLDSYNRCQFGCIYCFSSRRTIENSKSGLRQLNADALAARFRRVRSGRIASAIDEFIARRIPIQFGGINDPFSAIEARERTSLRTLKILRDFAYPTLISTKSDIPFQDDYLEVLSEMNVSLRVSASGVRSDRRRLIDRDCPDFSVMLGHLEKASRKGIPTTLRIQPVVPTQEEAVIDMIRQASAAGVRHVSLEYLKIPLEIRAELLRKMGDILEVDLAGEISSIGTFRIGPDITLATAYKLSNMSVFRGLLHSLGMSFGAGDTDLIHLSDGAGCCNGAGLLLRDCAVFDGNFTGMLKMPGGHGDVTFDRFLDKWSPSRLVNPYLVADSRRKIEDESRTDWQALMAYRWNEGRSIYSPSMFAGVEATGQADRNGFQIYRFRNPLSD
jgi:DNA repair photolyase